MSVVILQPSYIPWRGFLNVLAVAVLTSLARPQNKPKNSRNLCQNIVS